MSYDLMTANPSFPYTFRAATLCGAAPAHGMYVPSAVASAMTSFGSSPNGSVAAGWVGSALRIYPDTSDMANFVQPSIQPAGGSAGAACDVSANLVAIAGGSTAAVLVYDHSGNNIPIVATGLPAALLKIQFAQNGTKLLVFYSSSPFMRVYDTGTWAYFDVPVAGGVKTGLTEARNGRAILHLSGSPYHGLFDFTTGAYTAIPALSTYTNTNLNSMPLFCADPTNADCVFMGGSTGGAAARIIRYNTVTNAVTVVPVADRLPSLNIPYKMLIADEWFKRVYVIAAPITAGPTPPVFSFDAASLVLDPIDTLAGIYGSAVPTYAFIRGKGSRSVVSGSVRDVGNNPAAREVRALHSATGRLMGVTTSDASGNYSLRLGTLDPVDVVFKALPAENLNDLIYARVVPQPA